MTRESFFIPLIILFPLFFPYFNLRVLSLRTATLLLMAPVSLLTVSFLCFLNNKPLEWVPLDLAFLSLGLKLDILSGIIGATVLTIGLIVIRYSERYLEDDPHKSRFINHLAATLSCVLTMLMSANLVLFLLSWVATSYFLHKLLIHFSERPMAVSAAMQKFWVSRLGDLFIISSGIVIFLTFESLDFQTLFERVKDTTFVQQNSLSIHLASVLLVLGAMTKSAQFPFHYWLPNTMETPTPVSAIMHAGIINAGGYLVIRMSPLLIHAPLSLTLLAFIGGLTAFWASIVMLTQTNIKKHLAYSTISQMGFMMLQCGLGAFPMALTHIVGHGFYKAYSFLSSGTATDYGRLNRYYPKTQFSHNRSWILWAFVICMLALFSGLILLKNSVLDRPGVIVLFVILSLSAAQILVSSKNKSKALLIISMVGILYLSLTHLADFLLLEIAPEFSTQGILSHLTLALCTSFFVALYFIQNNLDQISKTEIGKRIYVRALNGRI